MKIIPDLCIFVCQQNYALQSLSAALLCRVEYNPVVLIIPPLLSLPVFLSALFSIYCSIALFGCSARPSGMLRLFDQVFIIGDACLSEVG